MCPSSPSRRSKTALAALLPLCCLLLVRGAAAEPRLLVSGAAQAGEQGLELRVDLANEGDAATGPLDVEAELLGDVQQTRLEQGLASGARASVRLVFEIDAARPGVHPVSLLLEYPGVGPAGAPLSSQRAFLLVALGANAPPGVRLALAPLRLETSADLVVGVESADGSAHRVRLRVETPRGLRVWHEPPELDVPAVGRVEAKLALLRSGAARQSRHGVVALAETLDGPVHSTAAATGEVEVVADPARLPRLRRPLAVLAGALVALAAAAELRRLLARRH